MNFKHFKVFPKSLSPEDKKFSLDFICEINSKKTLGQRNYEFDSTPQRPTDTLFHFLAFGFWSHFTSKALRHQKLKQNSFL